MRPATIPASPEIWSNSANGHESPPRVTGSARPRPHAPRREAVRGASDRTVDRRGPETCWRTRSPPSRSPSPAAGHPGWPPPRPPRARARHAPRHPSPGRHRPACSGELARLAVVEIPAAVADLDFPDPGPLLGQPRSHRDAQLDGAGRGVGIARHHQRAGTRRGGGQDAPGHRLIPLGPAPVRAGDPVGQDQLQRPGRGAFGQHRQVTGGDPAVPAPQQPVVGQRPAGQERPDHGREVSGPFQGQAGELQGLHERPDQQRVLPHAVHLAEQQQAGRIE